MTENIPLLLGGTAPKEPEVVRPKKLRGVYVPKVERPVHKAMFEYYRSLGKIRSIPRVSKHFGKSVPFISTLSRAFRWRERLQELVPVDPVVGDTAAGMDVTRTKIARFVNDIADTLSELSELSKKVRTSVGGMTEEDAKESKTLFSALAIFGIHIKTPRDLRDLIAVLKDITEFKAEAVPTAPAGKTEMHIDKAVILHGLDD